MASRLERWWRPGLLLAIGVVAVVVAVELIRPIHSASVGFDSAASVVYFDRIVSGHRLEQFLGATPKPILTVIYGVLMAIADDWRAVAWAAIASFAIAVVLATIAGWRFGNLVAGLAAAVVLLTSRTLLVDVGLAYALSWALAFWLAAALAVGGSRPRYWLAGLALGAAMLARLETVAILGVAMLAVVIGALRDRRAGRPVARAPWQLLVALGAFPIMLLHDWLLIGNPLYWLDVSAEFSRQFASAVLGPTEVARSVVLKLAQSPLILGLAFIGLVWLARRRQVVPLVGLIGMIVGVGLFLVVLGARGTYVSTRYLGAIELGEDLAAAAGVGGLFALFEARWRSAPRSPGLQAAASVAVGVGLVALLVVGTWSPASMNRVTRATVRSYAVEARHADEAVAVLSCAFARSGTSMPAVLGHEPGAADVVIEAPTLLKPRLAHDLGLPLWAIGDIAAMVKSNGRFLPDGKVVMHDGRSDQPPADYGALEVGHPTTIGDVTLTPLVTDAPDRFWLHWISRPGDQPPPTGRCRG